MADFVEIGPNLVNVDKVEVFEYIPAERYLVVMFARDSTLEVQGFTEENYKSLKGHIKEVKLR